MTSLFDPLKLGNLVLPNRVIMAPLTRQRSKQPGNIPWALNAEYYRQRASAGLIISEATQISQQGQGYPGAPGIHSVEQVQGWKLVTDAVHKAGGRMFLQLWHVGRISHSSQQPGSGLPVAPSAVKPAGTVLTADWKSVEFETPRALELSEIPGIIADYKKGAENAKAAGFDGVEVHGANGYLLDQFMQNGTNKRTDAYGGSIENRARLLLEVVDTVIAVWGRDRVGVRLSPYGTANDMHDSDPVKLFTYVLQELSKRQVVYAHVIEPRISGASKGAAANNEAPNAIHLFRRAFRGVYLSAGGYDPDSAKHAIAAGDADAVVFGRWFISNPDLPERIKQNLSLNPYDRSTFYGGAEKGYTDYPFLNAKVA